MLRNCLVLGAIAATVLFVLMVGVLRPTSAPVVAGPPPLLGDIDENGLVEVRDLILIWKALSEGTTAELPAQADVNLDGVIDIIDAVLIAQAARGVIEGLPQPPLVTPLPPTASIEINSAEIRPGEWRIVELWARDVDPPGLGAWNVEIDFDPDVGEISNCFSSLPVSRCKQDEEGRIRVVGVNSRVEGPAGDQQLAAFRFTCGEAEATTQLSLNVVSFVNHFPGAPQRIFTSTTNGTVTCSQSALPKPTRTPLIEATPVFRPKITVEHVEAEVGQPFSITVQSGFGSVSIFGFSLDVEYPPGLLQFLSCVTLPDFTCLEETPGTITFEGVSDEPMTGSLLLGGMTFQASEYQCQTFLLADGAIRNERGRSLDYQRFNSGRVVIVGGPGASGDVTCDGNIDAVDAVLVLQIAAFLIGVGDVPYWPNADVNGDGEYEAIDALLILQKSAGLL